MRLQIPRLLLLGFLCFTLVIAASPQAATDHTQLELEVLSIKAGQYEDAIQHFEEAVAADPNDIRAHLWMASAFAEEYIPGNSSPENVRQGELALEQYQKVLELDPSNMKALKGADYLNLQMKRFAAAKNYYRKACEIDPNDPEPYYSIAVIDWMQTYQPRVAVRAKLGLQPEQAMIQRPECWQIKDANTDRVAEGMEMLRKAIELKRDYDDAMAYMNLMYRERADIQCGDPKAYTADIKSADSWVDMTISVKERKARQKEVERKDSGSSISVDSSTAPNPQ
jgi:tetratricopeptide (TPR) repeat protein